MPGSRRSTLFLDQIRLSPRKDVSCSPRPRKRSSLSNIGHKLFLRRTLLDRRRTIVHVEFAMSILGMILMLIETECFAHGVFNKTDMASLIIKSCISLTTVVLVVANVYYHVTSVKILMVTNGWEDWVLALTFPWSYLKIFLELTICLIHPFPGNVLIPIYSADGTYKMASLDAIMSLLMLSRLYVVGKFIVVNHKLLTNESTQSIGALNRVQITAMFVFKALLCTNPGLVVISIMLSIVFIGTWAMRTCEVYYDPLIASSSYGNTIWLVVITFLTVGYGDYTPVTLCGRFVSVSTGFVGVGTTALLVAVLAQKLEQSRSEKYVLNYVMRAHFDSIRRVAASRIIKNAVLLWTYRRRGITKSKKRTIAERRLQNAIHMMRRAESGKTSLTESAVGLVEVANSVSEVHKAVVEVVQSQKNALVRQNSLYDRLDDIEAMVNQLLLTRKQSVYYDTQ